MKCACCKETFDEYYKRHFGRELYSPKLKRVVDVCERCFDTEAEGTDDGDVIMTIDGTVYILNW